MGENGGQQKDLVCIQFQEAGDSVEACDVEVGAGRSVGRMEDNRRIWYVISSRKQVVVWGRMEDNRRIW